MANHAIVIGIDAYEKPEWKLTAAVSDALRFARWALDSGGVPPENMQLLVSPETGVDVGLPAKAATRDNIDDAIFPFLEGKGNDDDRLFFYCAGHGVSAPGITSGGIQQPVLVPVDVTSLERRSRNLLGFSDVMPRLQNAGPREQFFFIDACRDFALEQGYTMGVGAFSGRWQPPSPEPGPKRAQYILYATAPGLQAYEKKLAGRGVFATALLDGLSGKTAGATKFVGERWELQFSSLVDYVQAQVKDDLEQTKAKDAERFIQVPQREVLGGSSDAVLATFAEMSDVQVSVKVEPREAWKTCKVRVLVSIPNRDPAEVESVGPPTKSLSKFKVGPGAYVLSARAEQFNEARTSANIYVSGRTIPLLLKPADQPAAFDERLRFDDAAEPRLKVYCLDMAATVLVWGPRGDLVLSHVGEPPTKTVEPGIYKVQLLLPQGVVDEETVEVRAGKETRVTLQPAPQDLGTASTTAFQAVGIDTSGGFVDAAEDLGFLASPSLASLLGFAAFAAHWPNLQQFQRLRKIGVPALSDLGAGESGLLVVLGTTVSSGATEFLDASEFLVRNAAGEVTQRTGLDTLPSMPSAAQGHLRVAPGPLVLELRLPGTATTRYALAALPDRVTVLVAVVDDRGAFEVHQYLMPLKAPRFMEDMLQAAPHSIRAVDLAQRYYAHGLEAPESDELTTLLYGKWFDPLLACIAGYSMVRSGKAERFVGDLIDNAPADLPEPSAMRNLVKFFGELPDSHVLAGLCQPEQRAEHYARALERGLPVFADGLRALHEWYSVQGEVPPVLSEPARRSIPGSPWTAWIADRPALLVRGGKFAVPPVGWDSLNRNREAIELAAGSVGKVLLGMGAQTGFLVGQRLVLTGDFGQDFMGLPEPASIDFSFEDGRADGDGDARRFDIVGVVARDAQAQIALIEIAAQSRGGQAPPAPLTLHADRPPTLQGCEVYVVGHPHTDVASSFADPDTVKRVFGTASGVKRVQPGVALGFAEATGTSVASIHHDAFTLPGDAGAPLIHGETGKVLGIHLSAFAGDDPQKQGIAPALWPFRDGLLPGATVSFD